MPKVKALINGVSVLYLLIMAGYLGFAAFAYSRGEMLAADILTTLKEQSILILGVVLGMIREAAGGTSNAT